MVAEKRKVRLSLGITFRILSTCEKRKQKSPDNQTGLKRCRYLHNICSYCRLWFMTITGWLMQNRSNELWLTTHHSFHLITKIKYKKIKVKKHPPVRVNPYLGLKVHVEDSVCFIHDQELESTQREALCVLHMIYQPTRRGCRHTSFHSGTLNWQRMTSDFSYFLHNFQV